MGENSLRSHNMGSSYKRRNLSVPTIWEVEGGREFPKVPLYGKWLLGEQTQQPLMPNCVGGGWWERIP